MFGAASVIIRPRRQKNLATPERTKCRPADACIHVNHTPAILKAWLRMSHILFITFNHATPSMRH